MTAILREIKIDRRVFKEVLGSFKGIARLQESLNGVSRTIKG